MAANDDDDALTAMAGADAMYWLLHPVRLGWRVAPGATVTEIGICGLDHDADLARMQIQFRFAGRRLCDDQEQADAAGAETLFVGLLHLTLDRAGASWRLSRGHVETLDDFLGYKFTMRSEHLDEYQARADTSPLPVAPGGSPGHASGERLFRIIASFAEHDERLGASAAIEVRLASAPARNEAVELIWPAIVEKITRLLGEGDWRPPLSSVEVVELREARPLPRT
jgi:hypothetical protein